MIKIKPIWAWWQRHQPRRESEYERLSRRIDATKSPIEMMFWQDAYAVLRKYGKLTPQVAVEGYMVDFLYLSRGKRIVIELDGRAYHSTPAQLAYDKRRENDLKALGYTVKRFTGSEVWRDAKGCARQVLEITRVIR